MLSSLWSKHFLFLLPTYITFRRWQGFPACHYFWTIHLLYLSTKTKPKPNKISSLKCRPFSCSMLCSAFCCIYQPFITPLHWLRDWLDSDFIGTYVMSLFSHALFFFYLLFYFIIYLFFFLLYNIVLVLPYINMNLPQVYMSSQSWTSLPPHIISLDHPCAPAPNLLLIEG